MTEMLTRLICFYSVKISEIVCSPVYRELKKTKPRCPERGSFLAIGESFMIYFCDTDLVNRDIFCAAVHHD